MFIGYTQNNNDQPDYVDQSQKLNSFIRRKGLLFEGVYKVNNFKKIKNLMQFGHKGILAKKISNISTCLQNIKDNLLFSLKNKLKLLIFPVLFYVFLVKVVG